jgi:hypothetical protein
VPDLSMTDERPSDGEILAAIVSQFDAEPADVMAWLATFDQSTALTEYLTDLAAAKEIR